MFGSETCAHDWCDSKWCFVDPTTCDLPLYQSGIDGHNHFVSYAACGNLGSYSFGDKFHHLRGETIHVAYPSVEEDGAYYFVKADGTRDGAAVSFINQVFLDALELNVVVHNVSEISEDRYTSPFTSCVHGTS